MLRYILKRLLQSLLTILIIVSVVFLLMRMMPTDYFFTEDELIKLTEAQKQSKLEAAGVASVRSRVAGISVTVGPRRR